jgi:hypothetical protein
MRFCAAVRVFLPAFAVALLGATPLCGQKADTVVLRNGDRVVGEIKSLDRDVLTYKTDDMGTLAIKWDKILRITSPRYFEVESTLGDRYYGSLQAGPEPRQVIVEVSTFSDTLNHAELVRITPIKQGFLTRLDGNISFGFTFQRANRIRTVSLEGNVKHRTQQALTGLRFSAYFQGEESAEATSRNSIALNRQRFLSHRYVLGASGQLEQNEELELDLRALLSLGGGRFLKHTNRATLLVSGGVAFTNEQFVGSDATTNLEAVFTLGWEFYRRDTPKSDIQTSLQVYPNLTDFGRVRTDLEASVSHEVVKDFTTGLIFFDKIDSRPPSGTGASHDFGITLTMGWSF